MTDPFTALRAPLTPVAPDPDFGAALRDRLERALTMPRGVTPVTATADAARTDTSAQTPAAVPYLAVADARAAIDWYTDVFGARLIGEPIVMPDGRIGHAELEISDGVLYLADEHPEIGVTAPRPGEATVSLMLPVSDADEVRARAITAGAHGDREPYDGYGQRNAWIVDPFGHRWGLHSPQREPAREPFRHGDVGYVSLMVPDAARATRFYSTVFGWDVELTGSRGHVRGRTPSIGIMSAGGPSTLFCCYAVDDIADAVDRVRAAGGTAAEPHHRPEGPTVDCIDNQGTSFALFEPSAGGRPTDGDLAYVTFEVVDSQHARAFYGAVLGWRTTPGSIPDGWQVADTSPLMGFSGGHDRATASPMWRVPDIARAVAAVRAAGGTASEPTRAPYGLTADCTDDQGMRFYLGEL
jgi:predicted enzyme related to lactoylglutathione lyase